MRTVAILQNQWFDNPQKIQGMYDGRLSQCETAGQRIEARARLDHLFLFYKCLTGRRIKRAFGEDFTKIVWVNASLKIGDRSASKFPHDIPHLIAVIKHYNPQCIMTFGRIAREAYVELHDKHHQVVASRRWLCGPHPASRQANIVEEMKLIAKQWRKLRDKVDAK